MEKYSYWIDGGRWEVVDVYPLYKYIEGFGFTHQTPFRVNHRFFMLRRGLHTLCLNGFGEWTVARALPLAGVEIFKKIGEYDYVDGIPDAIAQMMSEDPPWMEGLRSLTHSLREEIRSKKTQLNYHEPRN